MADSTDHLADPRRQGRMTGSTVGAHLGLSPYMTTDKARRALGRSILGLPSEFKGNVATRHGNDNERLALDDYEEATGRFVTMTGFHPFDEWLGASPDGLVGENGLVEIKCPYNGKLHPLDERPDYFAQIQVQLLCTNRDWCDFYVWTAMGGTHMERVDRDEAWLAHNIPALKAIFDDVKAETVLNPDKFGDLERDDDEWRQAASYYLNAKLAEEHAKNVVAEAKKRLIHLGVGKGAGVSVSHTMAKGRIDYRKAVETLAPDADVEKFRGDPVESWSIREIKGN